MKGWLAVLLLVCGTASALNNCLPADFQDRRGQSVVSIANNTPGNPFLYRPRCVRISAGTVVEFRALPDFGMHPLYGGTVSGGAAQIDPDSPIGSISSGTSAQRRLDEAGERPFFCDFHFDAGMLGSILVVPELFVDGFE